MNQFLKVLAGFFVLLPLLTACSSSAVKQRKEQRDKVAQANKFYCEFMNSEQYPDIEVALNIEMAKRCDTTAQFQVFPYKTPTEVSGIMYCCNTNPLAAKSATKKADNKDKEEIE